MDIFRVDEYDLFAPGAESWKLSCGSCPLLLDS